MAQGADQSPPLTDYWVGYQRRRGPHGGLMLGKQGRALQIGMPAEGSDPDGPVSIAVVIIEHGDLIDVDQHLWGRETQFQHRDQALAPGEDLGLTPAVGEQCACLLDGPRRFVLES